ncbi:hypothetical protein ACVWZW_008048 [Bradyrhizobium sp. F1.13.4]
MHLELAAGQRLPQIELKLAAQPRLGVVFGREDAEGAAALGFRRIHREIRALEQIVEIVAVVGRDRDADAGTGRDFLAIVVYGRAQRLQDLLGQRRQLGLIAGAGP